MWLLVPICCLAILHIAGDHVAVIPDLAGILGDQNIYISTLYMYIVFGLLFSAVLTWIGVATGQELVVIMKEIYGQNGKKILAFVILSVCIPASALTGGYFASKILNNFLGFSHFITSLFCLIIFSFLAAGHGRCLLILSNYIGLLLVPILLIFLFLYDINTDFIIPNINKVNWPLFLGLLGYNVGGMWSILLVEMGAYLSERANIAIWLVLLAKSLEGIFTLLIAYLALTAPISGPLALSAIVAQKGGAAVTIIFNIALFCTFTNAMVPAMLVNARQISSIFGVAFYPALLFAGIVVQLVSGMSFISILCLMSASGFIMMYFIICTAYLVHKYKKNQQ